MLLFFLININSIKKIKITSLTRGEFQYKIVKIPAGEIIKNVGSFLPKNSMAFIATDEQNKTFFKDFKRQFKKVI